MQQATREGCKLCPDFAAEHADIATGGIGQRDGWTLAVVRTQRGEDWLREAEAAGVIAVRPGEEDPAALALMAKLAARSGSAGRSSCRRPGGPADAPGCAGKRGSTRTT
jgi:coenzyme F420 hydrogenase subunit beta